MNLNRVIRLLLLAGFFFLAAGVVSWLAMMPSEQWLQNGYTSCLWSSTYQVRADLVPDRSGTDASGRTFYLINPRWDPNRVSCGTKGKDISIDFVYEGKRTISKIMKGYDPGPRVYAVPPFFLMAPFLNGTGLLAILLGCILPVAASAFVKWSKWAHPKYDLAKWTALVEYDADIKRIVDALAPFGQKYVDEFAQAFMALNDKKYLPQIIEKILATAKADAARVVLEKEM